jgi:hypothetical protein
MTKKKLNTDAIASELSGASAFFARRTPLSAEPSPANTPSVQQAVEPSPAAPSPQPHHTHTIPPTSQRPAEQQPMVTPTVPTNEQPLKRSFQRKKIRHTFDIYYDQLLSLRELALSREMLFGERVLLGDLVQEALDMFITKERNKE